MEQRKYYLFNYAFTGSLLLLILNDHIFKAAFHNGITGKLSDLAGMVVLPLLLAFIFKGLRTRAVWVSMALFAFWKSPLSGPFINAFNTVLPFQMGRVVDYSDLWAFLIVPLPYLIIKDNGSLHVLKMSKVRLNPAYLVLPTLVALIATTPPPHRIEMYYRPATGNINLKEKNVRVTVHLSAGAILEKLRNEGMRYTKDTIVYVRRYSPDSLYLEPVAEDSAYTHPFYIIDRIVIDRDTLKDIQFSLIQKKDGTQGNAKTIIHLNSLNIGKDLTNEEVKEKMTRYYKRLLEKYFNRLD